MIVNFLLDVLFTVIEFIFNLIPTIDLGFTTKMTWLLDTLGIFINSANYWLPLADMLFVLGAILIIGNFRFILWAANWVIRRIADIIP